VEQPWFGGKDFHVVTSPIVGPCRGVRKDTHARACTNTVLAAIFASKTELAGYPLDIVGFDAKFYGRMPLVVPTTRNTPFISETI